MNIWISIKLYNNKKGDTLESSFQNPYNYDCEVDNHGNIVFMILNKNEMFNDFNQIKSKLFEFLQLNVIYEREPTKDIAVGEIEINFIYTNFNQFGYTLFTPYEISKLNRFSINVNLTKIDN